MYISPVFCRVNDHHQKWQWSYYDLFTMVFKLMWHDGAIGLNRKKYLLVTEEFACGEPVSSALLHVTFICICNTLYVGCSHAVSRFKFKRNDNIFPQTMFAVNYNVRYFIQIYKRKQCALKIYKHRFYTRSNIYFTRFIIFYFICIL